MNKRRFFFLIFFLNSSLFLTDVEAKRISYEQLREDHLWHSSFALLRSDLNKQVRSKKVKREILYHSNNILEKIDLKLLSTLKNDELNILKGRSFRFYKGKYFYQKGDFERSAKLLSKVSDRSLYYAESRLILAQIYQREKKDKLVKKSIMSCLKGIRSIDTRSSNAKSYLEKIKNSCFLYLARNEFQKKNFDYSLRFYNLLDKRASSFVKTLLEKAWVYYSKENYNRSLGILVTYNSPLLKDYFIPESYYLRALSYHRLCMWDEVKKNLEQFNNQYSKVAKELFKLKKSFDRNPLKLSAFLLQKNSIIRKSHVVNALVLETMRKPYMSSLVENLSYLNKEIKVIENQYHDTNARKILSSLNDIKSFYTKLIISGFRKEVFSALKDIKRVTDYFYNIKLDLITRKKDLVYSGKNTEKKTPQSTKSSQKLMFDISKEDNFWTFDGEFWADELGDYSFSLNSQCQKRGD